MRANTHEHILFTKYVMRNVTSQIGQHMNPSGDVMGWSTVHQPAGDDRTLSLAVTGNSSLVCQYFLRDSYPREDCQ